MPKETIKIFARLKQDNPFEIPLYELRRLPTKELITFYKNCNGVCSTRPTTYTFKFERIFDIRTSQEEIFNFLAKPIIKCVLDGYNGTIFAYGQTGSGKTYTMTGSSEYFEERGIIPRSIEEIFNYIKQNSNQYSIYISYIEIYNEVGYDLLDSKRQITSLNELVDGVEREPTLVSNHSLRHRKVSTEEEAMMLLLVGDSNRITVETTRNMFSSRSHSVFTIIISFKNSQNGKIRRSKLNLIDLAGSERIRKSNLSGTTLKEAKHINLSLHYLQHVILALCQNKKYVPFRNSMLTYLLKDSLSGHSVTVLLANLDVKTSNVEECIATCSFAQRVANVVVDTEINKEIDPHEEIHHLKDIIRELRLELSHTSKFKQNGTLSQTEKDNYKTLINRYLLNPREEICLESMDMRAIRFCFKLLKQAAKEYETKNKENKDTIRRYSQLVEEQEKQIGRLKSAILPSSAENVSPCTSYSNGENFYFREESNLSISGEFYNKSVENIYKEAASVVALIKQCQKNILKLKRNLQVKNTNEDQKNLSNQQETYKKCLTKLQQLKNQSDNLKVKLKRETDNKINIFDKWQDHMQWNQFSVESQSSMLTRNGNSNQCNINSFDDRAEDSNKENYYSDLMRDEKAFTGRKQTKEAFKPKDFNVIHLCDETTWTLMDNNSPLSTQLTNSRLVNCDPNLSGTDVEVNTLHWNTPEKDNCDRNGSINMLYCNDPPEFVEFMSKIALTGDMDVDEEIVRFYRAKFLITSNL